MFHQFVYMNQCPFHLCELEKICYSCGQDMPFTLTPHDFDTGFICSCGKSLLSERKGYNQFVESWSRKINLQDERIINYLNLNPLKQKRIHNSILIEKLLTNKTMFIDHLISSSTIENRKTFTTDKKFIRTEVLDLNLFDEIYKTARDVLNSFEKYLLKTILSKHSHCIKRFSGLYKISREKDFPEICPYAYAYIFWKESFYNINPFYNERVLVKKKGMKSIELPFHYYSDPVKETILYITKRHEKISISSLNWIVMHLVWSVANNHFNDWINIANKYAAKSIRPITKYDEFNNSDLFSFVIDGDGDGLRSTLDYYVSRYRETIAKKENQMFCPYKEKKYKSIQENEISHLPMRLSINPGFDSEKRAAEKYLAGLKVISIVK